MTYTSINDHHTTLEQVEQRILSGESYGIEWNGIEISWRTLPLKRGGLIKRNKVYGKLIYEYRDSQLTRDEVLKEIAKPPALRQALIEAETFIECSMCGKVSAGKDAIDPYRTMSFTTQGIYEKRAWGLMFYRMNDDKINEPILLNICPDCMDDIYNGQYKNADKNEDD
jgi:hypothetical protein